MQEKKHGVRGSPEKNRGREKPLVRHTIRPAWKAKCGAKRTGRGTAHAGRGENKNKGPGHQQRERPNSLGVQIIVSQKDGGGKTRYQALEEGEEGGGNT